MFFRQSALIICFISSSLAASAGQATVNGSEEGLFTEDRYCVLIAKVARVWKDKSIEGRPIERAVLKPLATLAGTFDPALNATLDVQFYAGGPSTSIKEPPPLGATVMAVIRLKAPKADDDAPTPVNVIVSDICAFMPESSSLVRIKNIDDPEVLRTLSRIQQARSAGEEKREKEKQPRHE